MAATPAPRPEPDAIIIGAGLSGLVAAAELVDAGKRVVIVEQEPEASLGGQAHWSFGGLFLVDSPEQRRMGVKDSLELARQGGRHHAAGVPELDPLSLAIGPAGPAGVDHPHAGAPAR